MTPNRPGETHYRTRAETSKERSARLSWQHAPQLNQTVPSFANDDQSTGRTGLGITDKFKQIGKSANTDSVNNEDRLCAESSCIVNPVFFQWGRVVRGMEGERGWCARWKERAAGNINKRE